METARFSPPGKVVRHFVRQGGGIHILQGLGHAAVYFFLREPHVQRAERHVFPDRGHEELIVRLLEYHTHAFPDAGGRFRRHGDVPHAHLSGRGRQQAVEMEQQGGFSRPVSSDEGDGFSVRDAHGDAVQGRGRVRIAEAQVDGFYKMVAHEMRLRVNWPASMVTLTQRKRMAKRQKRRPPITPRAVMAPGTEENSGSSPPLHWTAW